MATLVTPNFFTAIAASPPVAATLPAIKTAAVMHAGHMVFASFHS